MNTFLGVTPFENVVYLPRFQTKNGENMINPKQISFLVAQGNYTLFHLKTGELVLTSLPLGSYVAMLEWYGFVRIHKSYLVNLDCLQECTIQSFSIVTFPNGAVVEIARRRRNTLRKLFEMHQIIFNP